MSSKSALFFDIPAAARPTECRSCRAVVYWIVTAAGKRMPVDCDADGTFVPNTETREPGRGISHFAECPDAVQWRKR